MKLHQLIETPTASLIFTLQPRNYTQLHNKLRSLLEGAEIGLFSRPDIYSTSMTWSVELPQGVTGTRTYAQLSQSEKDQVGERISMLQSRIQTKLSQDREMAPLIDQFFVIPGSEDIHVYIVNGQLQPIFSRWACRLTHVSGDMNPLEQVMEKYNKPASLVKVIFKFRDGRAAANQDFIFSFFHKESTYTTDEKGEYDLGRLRQDTLFTIYELHRGVKGRSYDFGVQAGEKYEVMLPIYTDGVVRVQDQHGKPLPYFSFTATQGKRVRDCQTDESGDCSLESVETGEPLLLEDKKRTDGILNIVPTETDREWVWRIQEYYPANARVQVKGKEDVLLVNHPVLVAIGESGEKEMSTGPTGILEMTGLTPGETIRISDKQRPDMRVVGTLKEGENEFVLQTNIGAADLPGFVKVRVLNHRGERLPNTKVDLLYRNERQTYATDGEGEFSMPKERFIDETKVHATVYVPKLDKKGGVRERAINKSFLYTTNKDEYELKLKRMSRWWWLLLLLLLPLLLLIRFEKTIYVKAYAPDKITLIPNTDVTLHYFKGYLYSEGRFFTHDRLEIKQNTGSVGYTAFVKLGYSFYSYLFQHSSPMVLTGTATCYMSDTIIRKFHVVSDRDTLKLYMVPTYSSMSFRLIDEQTIRPLPGAKARIITEQGGKRYVDSAIANTSGLVTFRNIPECARVIELLGEQGGYYPYLDRGKNIADYGEERSPKRVLPLRRNPNDAVNDEGMINYSGELPTVPCNEEVKSGGQGVTNTVHPLGPTPGLITIGYDMLSIPDKLSVTYNGRVVATTSSLVSGKGMLRWYYYPQPGAPQFCTVNVSAPEDGTVWQYSLGCPAPIGDDIYYY